ncbi:MAG TPA: CpaD family pilus assembly lipoprotein [Allosphingosinicella sp.]|nr:CpaD family pilus assembly lipoprotein [Allosphingosinicella sp.]
MSRFITFAAMSALGLAAGGCAMQPQNLTPANNWGLYSLHQPVVEHNNFVFDVTTEGDRVSAAELDRLSAWFSSIEIGYGDRVSVDEPRGYESPRARQDVARVAARFGVLLADGAPLTEGAIEPGTVRIVASRASASVPNCPTHGNPEIDSPSRTSSNYGCSLNSNLAAMIANPDDLVRGQDASGQGSAATAGRAIRTFRERPQTGAQPLPTSTTRNQQ